MNQMDVDPDSSTLKRPADFHPASSSADKHVKVLLPDGQLTKLSSNMDSRRMLYKVLLDKTEADGTLWRNLLSTVLMDLTLELANTDMKGSVISRERVRDIVKNFNKDQLEEWKVGVRNGVTMNDWIDLLARPELKIPKIQKPNIAPAFEPFCEQEIATRKSWVHPYRGEAAEALWTHIRNHHDSNSDAIYAPFCSVVQSSGMGKSRTVDELGKEHFSIPINLMNARSSGYPPADHEVRNFLTGEGTEAESYRRAYCFIDALFQHTDHMLEKEFDSHWGIEEMAREFRILMTRGQTMRERSEFRKQFYQQVVRIAERKLYVLRLEPGSDRGSGYTYSLPPAASCDKLIKSLKARKDLSSSCQVFGKTEGDYPLVILAFDEAHTLVNREVPEHATWSNFSVLTRVFRALYQFPLFALFLSTTAKIAQFTSQDEDTSNGPNLNLILPFTALGFDTLAKKVALDGHLDLKCVTHDSHIVHMGRPLFGSRWDAGDAMVRADIVTFAVGKLLNANPSTRVFTRDQMLACLSRRLPIQFKATTYISETAEMKQVERHMRVCLNIDNGPGFQSMDTVASSEPLLSEAAYFIMSLECFDAVTSLKIVLEEFAVHEGDRGEFVALLLLTLARDQAVGLPDRDGRPEHRYFDSAPFVHGHLFKSSSASALENLQCDFPDAKMHFNHFIKLHDFTSINKESLLRLMTRGAGVLCANSQPSIDAATVFLKSGTKMTTDNFGVILYRFKNDASYSETPEPELFESMDPYDLGILGEGDAAVPIIKIVFALAATTPSLHVERHDASEAYNAVVYDIWSAGLSPDYLNPIDPQQTDIWNDILQASYGSWDNIYKAAANEDARRSMNPGAAFHGGHWSRWAVRGAK